MKYTGWRTTGTRLVAGLAVLLALALAAGPASAHTASVSKSDPPDKAVLAQAPARVMAQFTEELDTRGSTMVVKDATGKQVSTDNGKVDLNDPNHAIMLTAMPAALPDGVYTVAWHALLTDGDASDGAFTFTVQAAAPAQATVAAATSAPASAPAATLAATEEPTQAVSAASLTSGPTAAAPAPTNLPTTGGSGKAQPAWPLAAGLAGVLLLVVLGASRVLRRTIH